MATREQSNVRRAAHEVLVSSPHLYGTPYDRQVVYILQHNEKGALGLVLDGNLRQTLQALRYVVVTPAGLESGRLMQNLASMSLTAVTWGPKQLDRELRIGCWMRGPSSFQCAMAEHDDLWLDLIRDIGRSVICDALRVRELPDNAMLN
jgi:putative AlgH/UPF0301 family transcriptional regulator